MPNENTSYRIEPLSEANAEDFWAVMQEYFDPESRRYLDILLTNPIRREVSFCGSIAYQAENRPFCIFGNLLRRAYCRQRPIVVSVGSTMALSRGKSNTVVGDIVKRTLCQDFVDASFTNTASRAAVRRISEATCGSFGVRAYAADRLFEIRTRGLLERLLRRLGRLLKIEPLWQLSKKLMPPAISSEEWDRFWAAYLAENEGLVTSRTSEEMDWIFGARRQARRLVVLPLREANRLVGAIHIEPTNREATVWRVVDLIALKNDVARLRALIRLAKDFIRTRTPAAAFKITGFPAWVQPLLAEEFPVELPIDHNRSVWKMFAPELAEAYGKLDEIPNSWYGLTYDGDGCL